MPARVLLSLSETIGTMCSYAPRKCRRVNAVGSPHKSTVSLIFMLMLACDVVVVVVVVLLISVRFNLESKSCGCRSTVLETDKQ